MKTLGLHCSLALLVMVAPGLRAEVRFEKTRVEILAEPDQEQVEAVFPFVNHGAADARILSVSSGCQCLSAKAADDLVAPQAASRITGVFKVTHVPGVTEKAIHVRVSEGGKERNLALTVAVEVRELVTIEPRTLTWVAGGGAEEQTLTVRMHGADPIRLEEVTGSRPGFEIRLETVKEGAEYRVHVKPQDATGPTLGVFRLKTDCKYPRYASPIAFGHVRKP